MPSFTENVRLTTSAGETLSALAKVNEAILKLRKTAAEPIHVKITQEMKEAEAGAKRVGVVKAANNKAEDEALKKRLADYKAIKAMNAEQGGAAANIRYGSPQSIEQARRMNDQLEESTKRINRIGDAYKHINQVAKQADVELSQALKERLANQVANRSEKADTDAEKALMVARKEREDQMNYGLQRSAQIQKQQDDEHKQYLRDEENAYKERSRMATERFNQEEEGNKRVRQMEQDRAADVKKADDERIRGITERRRQEEEGAHRNHQIAQDIIRDQEKAKRTHDEEIRQRNERGLRGVAQEGIRDIKRNMIYGGIGIGEELLGKGWESGKERSKESEQQFESGRTPEEREAIRNRARQYSSQYAMMSVTEGMTLQRHAIGETADLKSGQAMADLAAPFVALRTAAVGAEQALSENQKLMKNWNELGWTKKPELMQRGYEQLAKMSQVEGANFQVDSVLNIDRMMKAARYAMSPDALIKLAPLISIGEGAGRTGNEFAMLFKTLAFSGKALDNSVGKTNHLNYIDGTGLSDNKGGFNPEIARDLASGTEEGIRKFNTILNDAARKKGVNPEDDLGFKQWLTHVFANVNAQNLAMWLHENDQNGFIHAQLSNYEKAGGTKVNKGIEDRDIGSAQAHVTAKFNDLTAAFIEPFNKQITGLLNTVANIENYAAKNPKSAGAVIAGTAVAGGVALAASAIENPGKTMEIGLLTAIARNTAVSALEASGGPNGKGMGLLGKLGAAAVIFEGLKSVTELPGLVKGIYDIYGKTEELKKANTSPEAMRAYNKKNLDDDDSGIKDAQSYLDQSKKYWGDSKSGEAMADLDYAAKGLADALNKKKMDIEAGGNNQKPGMVIQDPSLNPLGGGDPIHAQPAHPSSKSAHQLYWERHARLKPDFVAPHFDEKPSTADSASPSKISKSNFDSASKSIQDAGDQTSSSIKSAGSNMAQALNSVPGMIAGAGQSVAAALSAVAAEIANVKISAPAMAKPNTGGAGETVRGPR